MKYLYRSRNSNLISLLVNDNLAVVSRAQEYFKRTSIRPTYRLIASTTSYTAIVNDPTTYAIDLAVRNLTITGNAATLTEVDTLISSSITLEPPAGWAYFDVTAVSTDERSIFYSQAASIGYQVVYQTTTTASQTVSIASNGFVTVLGTGLGSFNFRIFNGTSWSNELSFELNPAISISTLDIDDQIIVAQVAATMAGTNLALADAARVRYGNVRLDMQSYSASATPTFNVPNLTEFFNSGMPLGSATFELLRAS